MKDKVVLINYTGKRGAGVAYSYEMVKALIEHGVPVVAIISEYSENMKQWEELELRKVYKIKTYNSMLQFIFRTIHFMLFEGLKLKKEFADFNITSIYCPMIQPWTYLINCIFKPSKQIVTVHDPKPHSGSKYIMNAIYRLTAAKSDELIILSEKFREYSSQKYNKTLSQIHIIPHGNFAYYKKMQKDEQIIIYPNDKVNYLFFGRISKYKGLSVLAAAYRIVSNEFPECTLTIAGSGDFSIYEHEYIGLSNVRVINRWFKDEEIGGIFQGENIVIVLPYIDASQSGVIPIANEFGIPVIASNTGGLSEQVINNETGILVSPGNSLDLARAMLLCAKNKEVRCMIGAKAKVRSQENSWYNLAAQLINIINK